VLAGFSGIKEPTMSHSWKNAPQQQAIAYYRQSDRERQDDALATQRERVHHWAGKHGIEIVNECAEARQSASTSPPPHGSRGADDGQSNSGEADLR
jgi:hypothetical protein